MTSSYRKTLREQAAIDDAAFAGGNVHPGLRRESRRRALSQAMGRDQGYLAALLDPTRPSRARPTPVDLLAASDATGIPWSGVNQRPSNLGSSGRKGGPWTEGDGHRLGHARHACAVGTAPALGAHEQAGELLRPGSVRTGTDGGIRATAITGTSSSR
jgi:hypothetical protein